MLSLKHLGWWSCRLGSCDVIDHVTTGLARYGFMVSYRWLIVTNPLSCTVSEFWDTTSYRQKMCFYLPHPIVRLKFNKVINRSNFRTMLGYSSRKRITLLIREINFRLSQCMRSMATIHQRYCRYRQSDGQTRRHCHSNAALLMCFAR